MQNYFFKYQFDKFLTYIEELLNIATQQEKAELYLYRAQLKALIFDCSVYDDCLLAAKLIEVKSSEASLYELLEFLEPTLFKCFPVKKGASENFLNALEKSVKLIEGIVSPLTTFIFKEYASEILYFTNNAKRAKQIAYEVNKAAKNINCDKAFMISGYCLVRCCLALGEDDQAKTELVNLINYMKASNNRNYCEEAYVEMRLWINLTTGWSGDTPRYYKTPDGNSFPIFLDRANAIKMGIGKLSPTEVPFLKYGKKYLGEVETMKNVYVDVYKALIQFFSGDVNVAMSIFKNVYKIIKNNYFIMPLVEYGEQILPMINYVIAHNFDGFYDVEWLKEIIENCIKYEKTLNCFRE